jgi:hypothetical protein
MDRHVRGDLDDLDLGSPVFAKIYEIWTWTNISGALKPNHIDSTRNTTHQNLQLLRRCQKVGRAFRYA